MRRGINFMLLFALSAGGLIVTASPAQALTIQEFPTLSPSSGPNGIALGADGNVWFTERDANVIGRITPAGTVTEFALPGTTSSLPWAIAAGPDGNLWFTELVGNKIGRITTTGAITEFPIPTTDGEPQGITSGPDGRLWFTEANRNKIGRITTSGNITEFTGLTASSDPQAIAAGPDGNLWFTENEVSQIARITTSGTLTEFPVPGRPFEIAPGPDGNLWFTQDIVDSIGRMTTAGTVTGEFPIPTHPGFPYGITPGPDGTLWFTENGGNNIGQITTSGTISEYPVPTASSAPGFLAPGADGNMWFTEGDTSQIGRALLPHLNISYISYIPNRFFIPNITHLVNRGDTASWLMLNPGTHGVVDGSGMGLFGSQDGFQIGSIYSFSFIGAGNYAYHDPFHLAFRGKVDVPITVQYAPGTTRQAQVVWASTEPPRGFAFDIQVKARGSSSFVDWQVGVAFPSAVFGPGDPQYVGLGKYSFRARMRNVSNGASSGYSGVQPITLS